MMASKKLLSVPKFSLSFVLLMHSLIKTTHQKTIVTPTPWDFNCDNGAGLFPHSTDCQRFWICREPFSNINMIEDGTGKSSKLKPHLFKCPDGYHFDTKIRFCQRKEIATCGTLKTTSTTTTTTTERPNNRDIGLFGLLFGLP